MAAPARAPRPLEGQGPAGVALRTRRRSGPLAAAGVLLVAGCALAFALTWLRAGDRAPVLAVSRTVTAGQVITAADLTTARVSADGPVSLIPASQEAAVVGHTAATALPAGSLLTAGDIGAAPPGTGQALLGVAVKAGQFPPDLAAGDTVDVLATPAGQPTGGSPGAGSSAQAALPVGRAIVVSVSTQQGTPRHRGRGTAGVAGRDASGHRGSGHRADRPGRRPRDRRPVMPLISLVSLKGSPGVTTTALALAAAWPAPRRLLAELDPAGGDLEIRLGMAAGGGGLAGLAAAARRPQSGHSPWPFARELTGGLHVLPAPPGAEQAGACLRTLSAAGVLQRLAAEAADGEEVVIADCGRLDPGAVTAQSGVLAGVVLAVTRPCLSDLAHLAGRLEAIAQHAKAAGLVLVTGAGLPRSDPAYPAAEISQALDTPVLASMPADPRGVAALLAGRGQSARAGQRLPLARAARDLAAAVAGVMPARPGEVPGPAAASGLDGLPAGRAIAPAEVTVR